MYLTTWAEIEKALAGQHFPDFAAIPVHQLRQIFDEGEIGFSVDTEHWVLLDGPKVLALSPFLGLIPYIAAELPNLPEDTRAKCMTLHMRFSDKTRAVLGSIHSKSRSDEGKRWT